MFKYVSHLLVIHGSKKIHISLAYFNNSFKHGLMSTASFGIHKHIKTELVLDYKAQINTFQRHFPALNIF